jgi:hypothetical protein
VDRHTWRETEQVSGQKQLYAPTGEAVRETGKQTNIWKRQTKGSLIHEQKGGFKHCLIDRQKEGHTDLWTVRPTSKQIDVRETNR